MCFSHKITSRERAFLSKSVFFCYCGSVSELIALVVCRPGAVENRHCFRARIALGSVRSAPRVTVTGRGRVGGKGFGAESKRGADAKTMVTCPFRSQTRRNRDRTSVRAGRGRTGPATAAAGWVRRARARRTGSRRAFGPCSTRSSCTRCGRATRPTRGRTPS